MVLKTYKLGCELELKSAVLAKCNKTDYSICISLDSSCLECVSHLNEFGAFIATAQISLFEDGISMLESKEYQLPGALNPNSCNHC